MRTALFIIQKIRMLPVFLCLSWTMLTTGYAQTCGLVTNSGFENDLTNWTNAGGTSITSDSHSGIKAAVVTAQGGLNSAGTFTVAAGQQVTFQLWAKTSGSPAWAGAGLDFLDASGTEIGEINLPVTATTYTIHSVMQAAPAGTASARIWLWKTGAQGSLFADDFCLTLPDTQAPSVPAGLSSSSVTENSFTLTWNPSSDNVAVTGYEVFLDGISIGTPSGTTFNVTTLSPGTTYAMTVRARDAVPNWSSQSAPLNVTTSSPAGSNVALGKPVTASSSESPTLPPGNANDGNASTRWSSAFSDPQWIRVDLGATHDITRVLLNWEPAYASAYEIQVSGNDTNWTTIYSTSSGNGGIDDLTGLSGSGRYVRMYGSQRATSFGYSLWEFQVYGAPSSGGGSCGEITNNGFENGLAGWTNTGSASLSTDAHSGTNAAVIGTAEGGLNNGTAIVATGGQTVTFTFWGKVSGSPVWAGVGIDYMNGSGTEIGEETLPVTATTYTEHSVSATVPSGTTSINIWTWKSGSTGSLYLDDFCLELTDGGGGGPFDVTINKSVQHQTMEGFGFFGAMNTWWSSPSTLWSDAWGDQVISDLGITIWRNEYYPPADQYSGQDADWNKQQPVVEGLKAKADQYGVDLKFVFTVWSPPSSMKVAVQDNTRQIGTPHPFGTKQGGALDPTKYSEFSNWLIDGIELYEDSGIDVYAISPQNEPFFVHGFNSCWYKQEWYPEMLINAIPAVKTAYPNVKIFGSENMLEIESLDINWQWFYHKQILDSQPAQNNLDILAVHGYSDGVAPTSGSVLAQLWISSKEHFADPMGKPQWMTETSGYEDSWLGDPGAFSLAQDMMSALNHGDITGWIWWQGSENPGTSGIGEFALMNGLVKGKKYYASKQYYRYIRPGAVRVDATSTNSDVFVSAFQNVAQGTHTIVLINSSTSMQNITVGGANLPGSFVIFRTSATDNCANVGNYTTGSGLSLPGQSIVTLQAGGTPLGTGGGPGLMAVTAQPEMTTEEQNATQVFPNPMNGDILTVDLSGLNRNGKTELQLTDANGAIIRTYTSQSDRVEIRRQDLPGKGIYVLRITSGNEVENVRVVIK